MIIKQLLILLFRLITEPNKTWHHLAEKGDKNNENFYKSYLYPVIGIIALTAFIGTLISVEKFDVQKALKIVIKQIGVYFGSFYLSSVILSEFVIRRFTGIKDTLLCERFVGYSSALIYTVAIVKSLFPSLFFLPLVVIYSVYMIWAGAADYLKIKEEDLYKTTIGSSLVLLFLPWLIEVLIELWMPGMKIK
ncbi:MAG: YIP1 family protein [Dysgonamonadaceae bacterium]|jgi:uncharacterized membrane protein|nr:YIP1 family protein [Dysgonamonadaceae bacterium]